MTKILLALIALSATSYGGSWLLFEGPRAIEYNTGLPFVGKVKIRSGVYFEKTTELKACVLYLEGLGDSFMNQTPFFSALSSSGYRVITFNYMGQGGSTGTMNHTRIVDKIFPSLQISTLAEFIWNSHIHIPNRRTQKTCAHSPKLVLGWSTGGLAAYEMAHSRWADAVVLLAPGIYPKKLIGEAVFDPFRISKGLPVITHNTLTRFHPPAGKDPHIEPVKPDSPYKIPKFVANILATSKLSRFWKIPASVPGLVFVSDHNDLYVNGPKSAQLIQKAAPHFEVVQFQDAKHELSNEVPTVSRVVYQKTTQFFDKVLGHLE